MLSAKQEWLMASEWVKLTNETGECIYVNLANANWIFTTINGGSAIWCRVNAGIDGRVHVKEPPEKVFVLFDEAKSAEGA